jgi:hypothetical protein
MATPIDLNDGQFHHVAVVFDGSSETAYLDGVEFGSRTFTQAAYAGSYEYRLGAGQTAGWPGGNGGCYPFGGLIDEPTF